MAGSAASEPVPAAGQWLFRAELSGEEGSASLRLLLRRFDAASFWLTATDATGQARWELRQESSTAFWLDRPGQRFCRLDPEGPLRARLAVPAIRIADLPGLLLGEWPSAALVSGEEAAAATGARPFTAQASTPAEAGRGVWESWTLWQAGEPAAWFRRFADDSLLSARRPAVQLRWRLSASGALRPPTEGGAAAAGSPLLGPAGAEWPRGMQEMDCPDNEIP